MTPFKRAGVRYGRTPEPETPYQRAAQAWDDRIGSARVQARNWRLIAFGSLALSCGLAGGLVWQSARRTITPWVVQADRLGQAQAVAPASAGYPGGLVGRGWDRPVRAHPSGRAGADLSDERRERGRAVRPMPPPVRPAALGQVLEDRIQCPYHGLQFDRDGKCAFNPQAEGGTPPAATLKSYPLIETYGGLWIWMGDPASADASTLPDLFYLRPEAGYSRMTTYVHANANYELMSDNILDLSHVPLRPPGDFRRRRVQRRGQATRPSGRRSRLL